MTMISYAQNREDVLLARLFPIGLPGFYIDVGANDPVTCSLTKHFYDHGWHGINIEPAGQPFRRLAAERTRDVNLNIGLSDHPGTMSFFDFGPEASGASTFSADQAAWHRESGRPAVEREVPVSTLARVCEEHVQSTIDFMSIDVEGLEAQVIAGGDFRRWRPRVVLVEATEPATTIPTHERWEPALLGQDYLFAAFDGLNRFYVRQEDADLLPALRAPVNVLDEHVTHELFVAQSQLMAARASYQGLRSAYAGIPEELGSLRADYQKLDRALTHTRTECEKLKDAFAYSHSLCEQVRGELRAFEGVGPRTLELARTMRHGADRLPVAAAAARTVLRTARRYSRGSRRQPG